MVFLKVPQPPDIVVFYFLVENELRVVDLSRYYEWIDRAVICSSYALVDCTQIDSSVLLNDLGVFTHDYMVFVKLPLLVFSQF